MCSVDTDSSDLQSFMTGYDDGHHFTGCFGRRRRIPTPQGNGSHRGSFSLPPFASAFRSSRPTGRLPSILTALIDSSFLLSFHSTVEHPYFHSQSQPQAERRNGFNVPLNDPSPVRSNYSTSRSPPMLIAAAKFTTVPSGKMISFPHR